MAIPFKLDSVIKADALGGLGALPEGSVQCIVTSPPYWGLRDYGDPEQWGLEPTYQEYVERMRSFGRAAWHALREDGTLWLNLGDTYVTHTSATKTFDPKYANGRIRDGGRPNRTSDTGLKHKDLVGTPWRVALALQAGGWWLRSDIIWHKPNPMPESITDRPTKAHEYLFLLTKAARYHYDSEAIREESVVPESGSDGEHRWPSGWSHEEDDHRSKKGRYKPRKSQPKGSFDGKWDKDSPTGQKAFRAVYATRNKRSVWTIPTQQYPGAHFSTFPAKLVEPCILAGCPEGGIVCDPFAGSGTTGIVAVRHGRRFLGFDLAGGDKDLGGHTANQRIAAAKAGIPLKEFVNGQQSLLDT